MFCSRIIFTASLCMLGCFQLHAIELTSSDPAANAEIVIPENAFPSTVRAASEFALYIEKLTGKKLNTVAGKSTAERQVVIGTLNQLTAIPDDIRSKLEESKSREAFFIRVRGNMLYIVGKDKVAELFGVCTLLEDKLGIRWLKAADADDDYEYIPSMKEAKIPDGDCFQEPYFSHRKTSQTASYWNSIPKESAWWFTRNKMQFMGSAMDNPAKQFSSFYDEITVPEVKNGMGGHTLYDYAVLDVEHNKTQEQKRSVYEAHPEYFALVNGKRVWRGPDGGVQYCVSNPEVTKIVLDYILRHFQKYGTSDASCLFGNSDHASGFCECAECIKLDGGTFDKGNISKRMHTVFAQMAEKVYEKIPDAPLRLWAYSVYRKPPEGLQVDPRMPLQYCIHGRCYGHRLDDKSCFRNVKIMEEIGKWQKLQPKIYTYEYETCTPNLYIPSELRLADDIKLYKKMGFIGWSQEANLPDAKTVPHCMNGRENYPSCWQWIYVASKMLWNPDADVNAILTDIESKYYGKAYPAMKKYHDLRRKLWENTPICTGYPAGDPRRPNLLNAPGAKDSLLKYLAEAETLAGDDRKLQLRIAKDRDYLTRFWIAPNDEMKKERGNSLCATSAEKPVVLDGNDNEADWIRAGNSDNFLTPDDKKELDAKLKTSVAVISDDENLYFLINAGEPSPEKMSANGEKDGKVWADDGIELFIMSLNPAGNYYHIAVNTKDQIYDAMCPGENTSLEIGIESKTRILKDRYIMEIKVPVRRHAGSEFNRGSIWKIMVGRNRTVNDGLPRGAFSLDGRAYHDTSKYRCLEIGSPYLKNGSFESLKKGMPEGWGGSNFELVKGDAGNTVLLKGSSSKQAVLVNYIDDRTLYQPEKALKILVRFKASGKGKLSGMFYRYSTTDGKRNYLPTEGFGRFDVTQEPCVYTAEYTIRAKENVALAFHTNGEICIADVSIECIQ